MTLRRGMVGRRRVRNAPQSALTVNPYSILGAKLIQDLNSDLGVSVSAGKATAWADQGPLANSPAQATGSKQPAYVAAVLDGHAAVRSDGTDDLMRVSGTFAGLPIGIRPYFYVVVDPRSGSATYTSDLVYMDTDGLAGSVGNTQELVHIGANLVFRPNSLTAPTALNADLTAQLWTARYLADNTCHLDINNVDVNSVSAGALPKASLWQSLFDRTASPVLPGAWDLFRVIIADSPTAAQHASLIAYLKAQFPSIAIA
jgi:hypothetical protein